MTAQSRRGYFAPRWSGAVSLDRLFWVDVVFVGTLVNVFAGLAAMLALGLDLPVWLAIGLFLCVLPYNVWLLLAVWRTAEATGHAATGYKAGALVWFVLALLV